MNIGERLWGYLRKNSVAQEARMMLPLFWIMLLLAWRSHETLFSTASNTNEVDRDDHNAEHRCAFLKPRLFDETGQEAQFLPETAGYDSKQFAETNIGSNKVLFPNNIGTHADGSHPTAFDEDMDQLKLVSTANDSQGLAFPGGLLGKLLQLSASSKKVGPPRLSSPVTKANISRKHTFPFNLNFSVLVMETISSLRDTPTSKSDMHMSRQHWSLKRNNTGKTMFYQKSILESVSTKPPEQKEQNVTSNFYKHYFNKKVENFDIPSTSKASFPEIRNMDTITSGVNSTPNVPQLNGSKVIFSHFLYNDTENLTDSYNSPSPIFEVLLSAVQYKDGDAHAVKSRKLLFKGRDSAVKFGGDKDSDSDMDDDEVGEKEHIVAEILPFHYYVLHPQYYIYMEFMFILVLIVSIIIYYLFKGSSKYD